MSEELAGPEYDTTGSAIDPGFVEFAELMVKDETIPLDIKDMFWGFLNKEAVLSRSDQKDRRRSENRYAILRNFYLMSKPQYKVDINEIIDMQNAQHRNTTKSNRSFGGFERQALTTQIKELRTPRTPDPKEKSFLSGIKNRLGFGHKEGEYGG
jgi:hypothetical protein